MALELPTVDECIAAGRKLWGEPSLITRTQVRWGGKQGQKLDLSNRVWVDFTKAEDEADRGGGAYRLLEMAGMLPPKRANGRGNGQHRDEFSRTHNFVDEHGNLLFQECKRHDGRWVQRQPQGKAWVYKLDGVRRVLYRLPQLIAADNSTIVFICEGPKDCESLVKLGFVATCNPGGAGKWATEYSAFLRARSVVILPDCDKAGDGHERVVRKNLTGVAASVTTVRLPGLVHGSKTRKDATDWIDAGGTRDELIELVREARGEPPAWLDLCQLTEGKEPKPIPNLHNIYTALQNDPRFARFIRRDDMLRAALLHARPLSNEDVTEIRDYLQRRGIKRAGRDDVREAVELHASKHSFHPVRQYLDGLRWDQRPRLDTWLQVYVGTDPEKITYYAAIGKWWLISAVARIFKPGCQVDYCPVFEGPQGELKSSMLRVLGGEYFDDNLPDVTNKDASQYLRGKWIVEISEMHALTKPESTAVKSFLTRRIERYFARFGRVEAHEPRQNVFAGTSNTDKYIKDDTGGRRFWPVVCGIIKLDLLKRDRDQLFAEAVHRFQAGEQYWPDREFEREHIVPEQEARYDLDAWAEPITTYLAEQKLTYVTIYQVAMHALGFDRSRLGKADQMRIAQTLHKLGWVPKRSNSERGFAKRNVIL